MKKSCLTFQSWILVMSVLSLSVITPATAVEVMPLEYDFGEVEIGTSSTTVITIANYTGHAHIITAIAFSANSSPDFSIATDLEFPFVIGSRDLLEVEVVFSPSVTGLLTADLQISSIDNGFKFVVVSLRGGNGTLPPPGACAPSSHDEVGLDRS